MNAFRPTELGLTWSWVISANSWLWLGMETGSQTLSKVDITETPLETGSKATTCKGAHFSLLCSYSRRYRSWLKTLFSCLRFLAARGYSLWDLPQLFCLGWLSVLDSLSKRFESCYTCWQPLSWHLQADPELELSPLLLVAALLLLVVFWVSCSRFVLPCFASKSNFSWFAFHCLPTHFLEGGQDKNQR